ncbi:bifunctional transcriptional activator/DNA repair enzyme AdaA [Caldalkalibacillus mannanilyticus]|uniref:bifunctional transcriptional activator/DNA repair enzyme AdaA n=1 Tax=Caldalkalibacillus mannanilyticus TaxID=1418 RepID=UPI0004682409|nr:Ada metal-binding domain-containing protein [Caldalkalibacillus mannanilyticus]
MSFLDQIIPKEYWNAIITNDESYDGVFLYGVKTTYIYCRPSCKSKEPKIENVVIFNHQTDATHNHFRPCKRCKPDLQIHPNEEMINELVAWIQINYHEFITLEKLASISNISPFHLQRMFKHSKNMSPLDYINKIRIEKAIHVLINTDKSITLIAMEIGFSNPSYFSTFFKRETGFTPGMFRKKYRII